MAETNPFDQFDSGPAPADTSAPAAAANPFDQFDAGKPANAIPQTQAAVDQVPDETLPEVTVTAKRPMPPATWGETLGAVMPTIGSRIESKLAGIQEYRGGSEYADARKTFWQSYILPGAVREAKDANIALTDHPDVVDNAKRLGIRPDVFARDWPKYANMSEEELDALQNEQMQKMREGREAAETGGARRQLAAQVAEGVRPETGSGWTPKSIVFDALTGIPDILAASAATVAGGPVAGGAVLATSMAPEEYSAAKNQGADEKTAQTYAVLSSMAQAAPEIPVLKIIEGGSAGRSILRSVVGDTLAQSAAGRVAGTAATQGVSQAIIQSIQEGIDAGILDEQTSLRDALARIGHAGLVGAAVGVPLGGMHEAMSPRAPRVAGAGKPVVFNEEHPLEQTNLPAGSGPEPGAAAGERPGETGGPGPGRTARLPAAGEEAAGAPSTAAPEAARAPETRAALEALQDKTISPPQVEHLENLGLARRNDLGEPFMLPAGRRALAEAQKAPEAENPQTAAPEAEKSTKPAPTGDALVDRIAQEPDLRAELERMKGETGWAEVGGRLIRTPGSDESKPDIISRTKWIPNAEWWRERPKGLTEDQTHLAVEKALKGEPLGKRERAMVEYMVDTADKAKAAPQEAFRSSLEQARADTETAPTEAQKQAGNYQKGELQFAPGVTFTMENPKGSTRTGEARGQKWERQMQHDYGYINRTEGNDGDHVDAFLTGKPDTGHAFIVNQIDPETGKFDEHKVILGADTLAEAKQTYLANYQKGWKGLGSIVEMPMQRLRGWLEHGDTNKPAPPSEPRRDVGARQRVSSMSAEEMRQTLLTHELTGLPNRRAYDEAPKLSHQVAVDVDSLKWVNDTMGHEHGDELLKAVGSALKEQTGHAFHISGDEFVVQAKSEDEAHDIMREVADSLGGHTIEATGPEGKKVELSGLGLSYGVGRSLREADRNLSAHKAAREASGERAARGEKPPGATVGARGRERVEAEGEVAEPKPLDEQTLRAFGDQVKGDLGLEDLDLRLDPRGHIRLELLQVPRGARKAGVGTEAMERLTAFADAHDKQMVLSVAGRDKLADWGTTSKERLERFYRRFGFVSNRGRNKDYALSLYDNMYRKPGAPGRDRIREDQAEYSVSTPGGDVGVEERGRAPGDVQPGANLQLFSSDQAPAPADPRTQTHTGLVETGRFASGIKQVKRWQDAAHIFAPLRKSPQENFMALVLDAKARPLAVLRHSVGTPSSAVAIPHIIVGAIGRIQDAAGVYFGHNHPSGTTEQSQADELITNRLHDLLRGSGIDPLGMIVVVPGGQKASFYRPNWGYRGGDPGYTTPASRANKRLSVPVLERRFARIPRAAEVGKSLSSPELARKAVTDLMQSGTRGGVVLMDARHQVVATLPMHAREMMPLRTGDTRTGMLRVMRAVEDSNATTAITFGHIRDEKELRNLGSLLTESGMRVLDLMMLDNGGHIRSATEHNESTSSERGFYSKREPETRASLERQFMGKDDAFWHITPEDEARGRGSEFDNGYSGVQCTGYACAILHKLGPARVKVYGFHDAENPESAIARDAGGHDFAVVDNRWIVDPWLDAGLSTPMGKDDLPTRGVYDMDSKEDQAEIDRLYGDQDAWRDMSPSMPGPSHRAAIEQSVRMAIRDSGMRAAPDFPHVEVHADYTTLPRDLRDKVIQDRSERTAGAVYDPETGHIHMIAENLSGPREAQETLWHEAVGHHGLRLIMDADRYASVMDGLYNAMPDRVRETAERNGLDMRELAQRRLAAEEVIAYAAGRHLAGGTMDKDVRPFWQRALTAVKGFFARVTGKPFTDDAAIAGLIRESKRALETGSAVQRMGDVAASQRAATFYSPVERAISGSKQAKASPEQWMATIKKTPGIKPEELKWLGVEDWLKQQKGPVTREQLADYVRANKLELHETMYGEGSHGGQPTEAERVQTRMAEGIRALGHDVHLNTDGSLYAVVFRKEGEPHQFEYFPPDDQGHDEEVSGFEGETIKPKLSDVMSPTLYAKVRELYEASNRVKEERANGDYDFLEQERGPQYEEFTLHGGENYRELLLRLPKRPFDPMDLPKRKAVFDEYQPEIERLRSLVDQATDRNHRERLQAMLNQTERDRDNKAEVAGPERPEFKSRHWAATNVLAHVRVKDRTSTDGKKTLFLEELQSDWHQQGRDEGYYDVSHETAYRMADNDLKELRGPALEAVRRNDLLGFDNDHDALANIREHQDWKQRWPDVPKEDQDLLNRYRDAFRRRVRASAAQKGAPDAPFKTSWPMLIMKRMIRAAAEGGYERIAWTNGEQQADRYNLEKHVDSVGWSAKTDNGRVVILESPGHTIKVSTDADGMVTMAHTPSAHGLPGHMLSDVVGSDLAKKIMAEETGHLEGQDLRVGGHGQRGFYDDILPRETNKLIRKYGAQVGEMKIPEDVSGMPWAKSRPRDVIESSRSTGEPQWFIRMENGDTSGTWMSRESAEHALEVQQGLYDDYVANKSAPTVHSFDITPQMRDEALSQGFPMFWKKPSQQTLGLRQGQGPAWYEGVRRAVEYLHSNPITKDLRKLINPTKLSDEAKRTAVLARAALGNLAHTTFETQEHLEQFSRQIDRLKPEEQLEMMDAIEHGVPQPNADLQPVADALRKQLDTWREKVRGLGVGALDNFIENYFPHYWTQPGQAQRMVATIMGRRPLRGPASFLKMRTIPTIKEGMDAGLTPLTINPLVMTLLKVREMQRFVSGVKMMQSFKDAGLAVFLPATKPMPEGWAEIKDNIARVRQWSEEEQGFIERGRYIMPEDGARLINNHVGRSVLTDFTPTYVLRLGGNLLNAMQLGFSAFHLGFTTLDASISKNALGIEQLIRGEVGRAASSFAQGMTPAGVIANVRRGYKLMRAYADPSGATPETLRIVSALELAGGRVAMDRYFMAIQGVNPFRGVGVRSLVQDVRGALKGPEPLKAAGKVIANYPVEYATRAARELQAMVHTMPLLQVPFEVAGRTVRASTAWIMEHLVPMQKLGVFSDMASDYLRRNPTATSDQMARAMQSAWDSVDNRLGEMVYDNVFWNRTFKDANHLAVRAVGWNLGTIREIGGAPIDAIAAIDKLARTGKLSADDIGHKIPYVLAMTMTTAALGATINYMFTGEGPQELKDYFFPRTGGTTNRGTPQRVSLPSYVKDVYEYSQHPSTTVANKLNPIFSVLSDLWRNQDYFGNPISEPEASPLAQAGQRAAYAAREATPFSIQGTRQIAGSEAPGVVGALKRALPFVGVAPAPGYVTSPDQIARRERYEAEDKYSRELKYRLGKAMASHDADAVKSLTEQYVQSRRRVKELQMQMNVDKAKAAAARRQHATSMRQQGFPHTANLLASLPLEPDQAARDYFRSVAGGA